MTRGKKDRSLQDEGATVMKKLMSRTTTCCHPELCKTDSLGEGGVMDFTNVPIADLIDRCFNEPGGVNLFLDRAEVLGAAEQLLDDSRAPVSVEQALVTHACIAQGLILEPDVNPTIIQHFWSASLELKDIVMFRQDSVEKLTSLMALLSLAERVGADFFDILLTTCVSVARSLRIHTTAALESLCGSHRQRNMLKRAFWLLSCIDKEESMRKCKFEIVCDSHIDYGLPQSMQDCSTSSGNKNADWLEIRYKFASICSKINQRRVSSAEIGAGTAASNKCKADEIVQELDAWYEAIPEGLQVAQHVMQVNLDPADKRVALVGIHVGNDDYAKDLTFLRVPILAFCILVTEILTEPPVPRDSKTPLVGMAAGLFGRLASTALFEDLFQEFSDLCQITVQWTIRRT
ncbi:hypothetical protein B0J12DRAFT_762247 [Macrophomina phaseolina]|uniref:Uncharacterized protein n=1 Tax=Macrophomina phaseolina TaxID=35725 RepID=A0ABQ8G1I4_9PEZI|nr:hypothetical protein B0J12DRAFT_762247 [Macrophomina phaseolina]